MQVSIMTVVTIEALQLALEQYDLPPNPKDPQKLYHNFPVDIIAEDPSKLPINYTDGKLIDVTLGELLGLGVIGAYYQHFRNKGYHVVVGLDNATKLHAETILSDGAIREFGTTAITNFQQVSAQDYHLPRGKTIEDEIIRLIKLKEARRHDYPKKCVLLINIYAQRGGFSVQRIMEECSMNVFNIYYCIIYHLPELETCKVLYLQKGVNANMIVARGVTFALKRNQQSDT